MTSIFRIRQRFPMMMVHFLSLVFVLLAEIAEGSGASASNQNGWTDLKGKQRQTQETPKVENERFFPEASDATIPCWIPAYQNAEDFIQPSEGMCTATNSTIQFEDLSNAQKHALAVEYAPVLFFHPLEQYTLSSVDKTFSDAQGGSIWRTFKGNTWNIDPLLNLTTMWLTTRDPIWSSASQEFFFETQAAQDMYHANNTVMFGDGYDPVTKRSRAKIYYNLYDSGNGTMVINYFFFFPYNGEASLSVITSYDNVTQYHPVTLKPYGVHEGDWESISVLICAPDQDEVSTLVETSQQERTELPYQNDTSSTEPLSIYYRQHDWTEVKDCAKGECKFYRHTHHPVGFTAHNSHATYPVSAEGVVYSNINVSFIVNLHAVLVVDRTIFKHKDGSFYHFFPDNNNLEAFLDPYEMTVENTPEEKYWQAYGGRWGYGFGTSVDQWPPYCLANDQLSYEECPPPGEDTVFDFFLEVLGLRTVQESRPLIESFTSVTSQIAAAVSKIKIGPEGPIAKGYLQRWLPPENAPFWKQAEDTTISAADFCRALAQYPDTTLKPVEKKTYRIKSELLGAVILTLTLTVLNFAFALGGYWWCADSKPYEPIPMEIMEQNCNNGGSLTLQQPSRLRDGHWHYSVGAVMFTVSFLAMFVAGLLFLGGIGSVFGYLKEWVPDIHWDGIETILSVLGSIILVVNSFLLLFLWLQVLEMRNLIHWTYEKITMDHQVLSDDDDKYVRWSPRKIDLLFRCCFALLFLSMLLSMLCFLVGAAVVGFIYAFVEICNTTSTTVIGGVCMDLNFLGIPEVKCGSDFVEFCAIWTDLDGKLLFWSGLIAFISHFYMVGATGYAAQHRRSIPAILAIYRNPIILATFRNSVVAKQCSQDGRASAVKLNLPESPSNNSASNHPAPIGTNEPKGEDEN